jgi:hypothetical protein
LAAVIGGKMSRSFDTKKVTLNGILGALAVISLLLAAVLPTNRLSFYALSSFFVAITIIEYGIKAGWLLYAATALLSLIVLPDKLAIVPYVIFFGIYGIIKLYIERINKIVLEYILKVIYFNICLVAAYYFIKQVFFESIKINLPWWLLIIALEIVFIVYDYVYTLFIRYYREKLQKVLKLH